MKEEAEKSIGNNKMGGQGRNPPVQALNHSLAPQYDSLSASSGSVVLTLRFPGLAVAVLALF